MTPSVADIAIAQHGVFTRADALRAGFSPHLIDSRIRRGRWLALQRGIYVERGGPVTPQVRASAALIYARPFFPAVVSHQTAARLHRISLAWDSDLVDHLTVPRAARRCPRHKLRIHPHPLCAEDVTTVRGLATTTPARTVADLLRDADRLTAIWAIEHTLRLGTASGQHIDAALARMAGQPFVSRARQRRALADRRSESPLETGARLLLLDAGLPVPVPQYEVLGAARWRLDLAWPELGIAVELDGRSVHEAPTALLADRRRQNDLEAHGWLVLRFTWADVFGRPAYVVDTVSAALRRRAA